MTPDQAIARLRELQSQIIDGPNPFKEIADCMERLADRAEAHQLVITLLEQEMNQVENDMYEARDAGKRTRFLELRGHKTGLAHAIAGLRAAFKK